MPEVLIYVDVLGGRVYDYTMKYPPDNPGEEHKENARVWNVLLDETESHDRDMLQGFRDIIDGVLIFASLFSAVVTTLVAQTSQALQPDNAQITASLLVETNLLLRAAGNITTISTVPTSPLSVGSAVHTSKDVWVNALFFTSLALSLSTALLTVLVKQWLHNSYLRQVPYVVPQAYSSFITGDARTRALITDFRSESLRTWRVREIIEALPLILHGSVLLFFVGLVLYVSQLSAPICGILALLTILAFTFYLGSLATLDSFQRLLQTTSQRSTHLVIIEAVFALLQDTEDSQNMLSQLPKDHEILRYTLSFSLIEYVALFRPTGPESSPPDSMRMIWENRISFLNEYNINNPDEQVRTFSDYYHTAESRGDELACERILDWIGHTALEDRNIFWLCELLPRCVTGNGVRQILKRITKARAAIFFKRPVYGVSLLHYFIRRNYLDAAKAVIEADQSDDAVNFFSSDEHTPLDIALDISQRSVDCEFLGYMMDHGARASQSSYEAAFLEGIKTCERDPSLVRLLWNWRREVRLVDTRPDSWCMMSVVEVADKFLVEESQRRKLIEILEECDDTSGDQDQPPITPSVEEQLPLLTPFSDLEGTVNSSQPTSVSDSRKAEMKDVPI
ncbi:hypothetical protein H0H93_010627 [Arthromyces matolae]|nr:hypothetical protein H0H93_010627 [Arthromyces matolae]